MRGDRIDILVDLVGHMEGNRLLLCARKPAPIQVTAWGEPTGTGLKTMDYLLADPILVPAVERPLLAERVVDLPNFLCYWRPHDLPEPGPLSALAKGYVTFGSFNRIAKIQAPVLRCWAAILSRLPDARLVLKINHPSPQSAREACLDPVFAEEGIDPARVTILGRGDRAEHFTAYQGIDIALDPFPHGGGMTTLDALWMGVPVVTWAGATISSRLAAASLTALGLTDCIAPSIEAYVDLAVAKAADLVVLAALRKTLRPRLAQSVIGDCAAYARAVEAAYRDMWRRWVER
jgi:predicted O-linked N-acetylglucosamine transferase (SPINDLY family)